MIEYEKRRIGEKNTSLGTIIKEITSNSKTTRDAYSEVREFKRSIKILEADTDFVEEKIICSNCGDITYYMEETWCRRCGTHFSEVTEDEYS